MAVNLPFGFANFPQSRWGTGPGGDTGAPIYKATQISPTPSNIASMIAAATTNGYTVFANLAGNRDQWTNLDPVTNCKNYDQTLWQNNVRRFTTAAMSPGIGLLSQADFDSLTSALASRRLIHYLGDEPNIGQFCDTIHQNDVNNWGLFSKSIWPNVLTAVRARASVLQGLPNPEHFNGVWTGVDYSWYQLNKVGVNNGLTRRQTFDNERAASLALDMGLVPAYNWLDGGDGRLWTCDPVNQPGVQCRVAGQSGVGFWLASPAEMQETADAIFDDADAPIFTGYTTPLASSQTDQFQPYEARSDYIAAFDYMLNKFATRPKFNGFRPAKGATVTPPPATTPIKVVGVTSGSGEIATPVAHQANDVVLVYAFNGSSSTIPSLATGYSPVINTNNVTVAERGGWKKSTGSEGASTWTGANGWICVVLRGVDPAGALGDKGIAKATSNSINWPTLTAIKTDGTSMFFAAAVHDTATGLNVPPTGMTNLSQNGRATLHYTSSGATGWASQSATVSASGNWRSAVFEILGDPALVVAPVAPVMDLIPNKSIQESSTLTFPVNVTDPDTTSANLVYSLTVTQAGATFVGGTFTWTPGVGTASGSPYSFTAKVCDDTSPTPLCDSKSFSVTVTAGGTGVSSITRQGSASSAGTSVALPTHATGDMIVITAFDSAGGTNPSLPAGYTVIGSGIPGGVIASKTGYKIAASNAEVSGTWTGATSVHATVFRGIDSTTPFGATGSGTSASSGSMTYPALTLQNVDGSSWVYFAGIHQTATDFDNTPTGLTRRTTLDHSATFDTNAGVTSRSSQNVGVNASAAYRVFAVEIRANPAASGVAPVLNAIGNKSVVEQALLAFTATATDVDTDPSRFVFSLTGVTATGAVIDAAAGVFTYTPGPGSSAGSPYSATINVSDGTHTTSETISITVTAPVTFASMHGDGRTSPRQRNSQNTISD
jgi:hypothetical protein